MTLALPLTATGESSSGDTAPRKVVFWNLFTSGSSYDVVVELVDRFNRSQSEFVVEQVDVPYSHIIAKILPAVAGGVAPDLTVFDRFQVASYAARNAFQSMDEYARRDGVRGEDFFEAPWQECLYDGRLYAVPYDTDVRLLYYNRELFRQAGLDPDRPPRTWSEMREMSRKLTRRRPDGRLEQIGAVPIWGNTGLYLYCWQKEGRFLADDGRRVTLDDPRNVEALTWIRDYVREYGIEQLLSLQTGFGADSQNPFITGRIAMIVLDVGTLTMLERYGADLDWAAAPAPYADDGVPATWSGGFSLVMPRGSKQPEGAWRFARFILRDESQRFMATSSNKLPALLSAGNDPFFQSSPFWRLAIDQMRFSHYRPVSAVGAALSTEMGVAVDQVIHGKLSPQEALTVATRETQAQLDRFLDKDRGDPVDWSAIYLTLGLVLAAALIWRGVVSGRRIGAMTLHRRQAWAGYLFALPALLGLLIFTVGPIVTTFVYSFTRYEIITPATWEGVDNYVRLFTTDRYFLIALWNTLYFTAISVPVSIAMSLGLAMLLNRPIRGRAIYRALFYLPTVVPLVAGSLLWAWLFNGEYGLINIVLGYLGLPQLPWLTSEHLSKPALVIMGLWNAGGGMIIFLAALQGVPRSLQEAARLDGAGRWASFRHVTLPMISPAMFFMTVMGLIGSLQVFAQAYLMTNGGPVNSTLFYVLHLFREAFQNLHMGTASAMAWVLFLVILTITGVQFVVGKRWVYYEGGVK
ncbi:MAG TPA: extracellular solute-binding protein [Candidatus Latescibacteria bacterium]|nr:extracellular solute-binding protein [Candidatus Latescibacterota bacterium]HJP32032.1 extracellular solute-binding protein [Candidatus Latescibacterota bacterium]